MSSNRPIVSPESKIKPKPFGHYFILEKIAQGGMAEIFKGLTYDFLGIKKLIVIKRILPHIAANQSFIEMLVSEAKIAVNLSHGNIAQIFDLGKVGDDYFIVMEYIDGKNLSEIQKKCREKSVLLPIEIICYFVSELCNGLDYIHRKSDDLGNDLLIVHRDISPQNILVSYSGNLKIVDFGVAKATVELTEEEKTASLEESRHAENSKNLRSPMTLKGKFAYMSPEQAKGEPIDHRSDLFSTGVILWELLTGQRLFKRESNSETMGAVREMKVLPPSHFRPEIPSELDQIVLRALEKNRLERHSSAHDISLELTRFLLKNYPDFKPSNVGDFLSQLFGVQELSVNDLEKGDPQEATLVELTRTLGETHSLQDLGGVDSIEKTEVVDPLEITFHSIFDEISWEDEKENEIDVHPVMESVFKSDEEELSVTGVFPLDHEEEKEETGVLPIEEKGFFTDQSIRTALFLIGVLVILGILLFAFG